MPQLRRSVASLLQLGERHLKTDVRYLFTSGGWLGFGNAISSGVVFLVGVAFANLLPVETYGQYKYLLSLAALLSLFSLPGIMVSLTRTVAKGERGVYVAATLARFRWGLWGSAVGISIALFTYLQGEPILALGIALVAIFVPIFDTFATYSAYLQGTRDFRLFTLYGMAIQLGSALALFIALISTDSVLIILLTYLGSYTVLRFIAWKHLRTRVEVANPGASASVVREGKHLSIMDSLSHVAAYVDHLLLFMYLGPAAVATYAIAIAPPEQLKYFLSSIQTLLLPRFAERDANTVRHTLLYKGALLVLATLPCIALYIIAAPYLFALLFPQYELSVLISQLFSLSLLNIFFAPFLVYLQAYGHVRAQYTVQISTALVQIGSMFVGILLGGLLGLIIARILTRFATGLFALALVYRLPPSTPSPSA